MKDEKFNRPNDAVYNGALFHAINPEPWDRQADVSIPERCKTLLQLFVDLYRRSVGQITGTDPVETALANFGHVVDVFYNPDNPIARLWKEQIKRWKDLRNLEV